MSTVIYLKDSVGNAYQRTFYSEMEQAVMWRNDVLRIMVDTRGVLDALETFPTYDVKWNRNCYGTIGLPPQVFSKKELDVFIK